MSSKLSRDEFLQYLSDSGLFSKGEFDSVLECLPKDTAVDGEAIAQHLIAEGKLTKFQVAALRDRSFEDLVIGNYQVLDRLGQGGMGTVYKAKHRRMKRIVAIKVLSATVAQSAKFVQRFQREVEAVARLAHPNIIMAFDADEAEVGHFLVMEFVDGRDLASEVQQRGPLPIAEAVDYIVQAGRALEYAHSKGIIHRDIKPANLMRDVSGTVKVADLGLARFNEAVGPPPEEAAALTQAGTIMGTVDYMPPEQAMGLTNIDHRADIYSLGCTLYFLLNGSPPYQGPSLMVILLKHREAPIPTLRAAKEEVPAALDAIFQRMLAKKPEDRYGSTSEVVAALEAFAGVSTSPTNRSSGTMLARPSSTVYKAVAPDTAMASQSWAGGQTVDLAPEKTDVDHSMLSVLLVEPSRTQAVVIRKYLQELGYTNINTAPSGQKAMELASTAPPRLVISAMHLADMTGVQLAHAMRAEPAIASVGFLLITSQSDAHQANLLSQVDHTVRLQKPFDVEQFRQAVATVTGGATGTKPRSAVRTDVANLRVLLVDDSAAARSHVRSVLTGLGLKHITEALDGADAVTLLGKETFGLVVTDYNMPRLDGCGLLEYIRQRSNCRTVPVILVTTEKDPTKLDAVRKLGVSAICEKSFKPEIVKGILERLR
jgi:serine/threonine protein kinase